MAPKTGATWGGAASAENRRASRIARSAPIVSSAANEVCAARRRALPVDALARLATWFPALRAVNSRLRATQASSHGGAGVEQPTVGVDDDGVVIAVSTHSRAASTKGTAESMACCPARAANRSTSSTPSASS